MSFKQPSHKKPHSPYTYNNNINQNNMYPPNISNKIPNSTIQSDSLSQRVQLYLSCRNLLDLDTFSKSDPYIKIFFKLTSNQPQIFIGKTQTINNNLNPNFNTTFIIDYIFQTKQQIRFQVYDEDNGNNDQFIGSVTTTIGTISGSKNQTLILNLQNKNTLKKPGKLIIRLQPCTQCNIVINMKWKARKLINTDSYFNFWDKSDPYLKFLKIRSDNSYIQSGRTQIIPNNLSPNWKNIQITKNKLINDQLNASKIKIQCWDWEEKGQQKHQFIGQIFIQLSKLQGQGVHFPIQFPLINKKHKNPGFLILQSLTQQYRPTFLDYIRGGLQLNLSIAIDFTASNGTPTFPSSLHYINPTMPNQYQYAISAVGKILLNYDSDQRIPCFGFGAKIGPYRNVSHCFPLSGDPQSIQAFGLQHLMELYNKALFNIQFSGPTLFSPIIEQVLKLAKSNIKNDENTYQILLILTDGQIHDMQSTVNLIVSNCHIPLSIIIVGIGNSNFDNMQTLDGDNGLYDSNGKKASRDVVQFVPFRNVGMNPDLLAKQLLAQLPNQVTTYMRSKAKMPNQIIQPNMSQMFMSKKSIQISPQQAMRLNLNNFLSTSSQPH